MVFQIMSIFLAIHVLRYALPAWIQMPAWIQKVDGGHTNMYTP